MEPLTDTTGCGYCPENLRSDRKNP